MKTAIICCICTALLCVAGSCKKEAPASLFGSCATNFPTVKSATDLDGMIGFSSSANKYYISYHQPGTYDVVDAGVLCGTVPDSLQTVGKRVVFSGQYKVYENPPQATAGTTFYYLDLSKIRIRKGQ